MVWTKPGSETEAAAQAVGKDIRASFANTSGYSGLSVYVNYAVGDEKLEEIYGASKLPRLAALKQTWDPQNVFSYHHPLPQKYP